MLLSQTDLEDDRLILMLSLARITFLTLQEKKIFANNIDNSSKLALLSISIDVIGSEAEIFSKKIQF